MRDNNALGKATEFRVASELLIRGFEVYFATADSGTDLVLGNGRRLQIKGAHLCATNKNKPTWDCQRYTFSFKSWRKVGKHYEAHNLANVDYVILWGIEDNAFFIIPADAIRGKYSVRLNPTSTKQQSSYMAFKDNWESLK